jgi:hypothetical protein
MKNLIAFVAFLIVVAGARAEPSLAGQWKSDNAQTMQFNKDRAKLEDRTVKFLSQLMGRMTITFTEKTIAYEMKDWEFETEAGDKRPFKGFKEVQPYRIIGSTPKSIAIQSREPITGEESITVLNFVDPNTMWVYSGKAAQLMPVDHIREYFVRLP